jgi:alkyldihydroxyacetonephosphate synthase
MQEIYALRYGQLDRVVDAVVYVASHEQAENLVKIACKHNVVLIPFGGGTNVTQALLLNKEEKRMIVSVDLQRLNHVKWVDKKNMTACIEAGIMGKDLEKELAKFNVICGHEPDSVEFSTLGGWISTRASGMKKNVYGNIEDIIVNVKIVTPIGTITKASDYPRISSGPDLAEIIMGSEGNYGIITEAVIRVREAAQVRNYGSIVFTDWDTGYKFMYDVARSRIWPASIRLVDNVQFQFGLALKPEVKSKLTEYIDKLKKAYLLDILKFDPQKMVAVTLLFEGSAESVALQEKSIYGLAKKHGGIKGGAENGLRGYFLTFAIAYLRDLSMTYSYVAESFETAVPWSNVLALCTGVRERIEKECKGKGIKQKPFVSFRLTQVYETGATIYVYFGFRYDGLKDPVSDYSHIEDAARDEVMKLGGSISHHHGVGKLRKKFINRSIGENGVNLLKGIKEKLDPMNIFATGNTY